MLDKVKDDIIGMLLKRYIPIAAASGTAALAAGWAAHHGAFESWGLTFFNWPWPYPTEPPSGPCLLIELTTRGKMAWLALVGAFPVIVRMVEHYGLNKILPTHP